MDLSSNEKHAHISIMQEISGHRAGAVLASDCEGISAVLNTYNAAAFLCRVLEALAGFDEIVVCDMESTDGTLEIARSYGCRVVTFPRGQHNICEPARSFAIGAAQYRWVLVVDADEIVTPALRNYLYARIARGDCPSGLFVARRNMFMGRYIHSSADYQLRFLERERAAWPPVIHAIPRVDGRVERIPQRLDDVCLLHLDDANVHARVKKMNRYTDNETMRRRRQPCGAWRLLWRPVWFFLRSLLLQGGWRDGCRGIVRAHLAAVYQILLLSKVMEEKWRRDEPSAF